MQAHKFKYNSFKPFGKWYTEDEIELVLSPGEEHYLENRQELEFKLRVLANESGCIYVIDSEEDCEYIGFPMMVIPQYYDHIMQLLWKDAQMLRNNKEFTIHS